MHNYIGKTLSKSFEISKLIINEIDSKTGVNAVENRFSRQSGLLANGFSYFAHSFIPLVVNVLDLFRHKSIEEDLMQSYGIE